nr:MAG TPA: hypothetical protein [Caudoviricetes sp.]
MSGPQILMKEDFLLLVIHDSDYKVHFRAG